MATVIAVRFQKAGKLYYFDPAGIWANPGDHVIVETVRGIELGEVITSAREVPDEAIVAPLKNVLRLATEDDLRRAEANALCSSATTPEISLNGFVYWLA